MTNREMAWIVPEPNFLGGFDDAVFIFQLTFKGHDSVEFPQTISFIATPVDTTKHAKTISVTFDIV